MSRFFQLERASSLIKFPTLAPCTLRKVFQSRVPRLGPFKLARRGDRGAMECAHRVLSSPGALFLFLFYLLIYLFYFSDRIQSSGYFTTIAPSHRTLSQLLANSTSELDTILEEAKEKWLSDAVLHATVDALTPRKPAPPPSRQAITAAAREEPRWAARRLRLREPIRLVVAGMPHSGSEWLFQMLIILLEEALRAIGQQAVQVRSAQMVRNSSAAAATPASIQASASTLAQRQAWDACRAAAVCVAHAHTFDESLLDGSCAGLNFFRPRPVAGGGKALGLRPLRCTAPQLNPAGRQVGRQAGRQARQAGKAGRQGRHIPRTLHQHTR